ncbi:flagellar brake protein [Candidatus Omnitrophota bacterium]
MTEEFNNQQERRNFPRLATTVDVEYTVLKNSSLGAESITKNISAGGICLIVYEKIEPGTFLSLRLYLADINLTVAAEGHVIWSSYFTMDADSRDRYDLGIEFTQIKEEDRQKLSKYVFKLI